MTLQTRAKALFLAALTVFVMLFSVFFIASEKDHNCAHENCPICEQIAVCENTLKHLSNGTPKIIVTLSLLFAVVSFIMLSDCAEKIVTPVSLKVRLLI